MTLPRIRVLLVEDNPGDARLIRALLEEAGPARFDLRFAETLRDALAQLARDVPDVVLLDLDLPDERGSETVAKVHGAAPQLPIVVLTGTADEEAAVRAVEQGAQEYLVKGRVDGTLMMRAIRHAVVRSRAKQSERLLSAELQARTQLQEDHARARFVADSAHALALAADVATALSGIVEKAAQLFGGGCAFDRVDGTRVADAAVDGPTQQALRTSLAPASVSSLLGGEDARVIEDARVQGIPALTAAELTSAGAVAVRSGGRRAGQLVVCARTRRLSKHDLEALLQVADILGAFLARGR